MRTTFRTLALLTMLLMSLALLACNNNSGQQAADKTSLIEEIQKRGVLRVGMSTFVPWAMKDKTGKLIGFEIDVATRLAEDMVVKVEFVPTKWSGIIPALLTGKFDVIYPVLMDLFTEGEVTTEPLSWQALAIGDTIWVDENGDGVQDAGETGIANVTVELYEDENGNGVIDPEDDVIATTTTDENGTYAFPGLPADDYIVVVNDTDNVLDGLDQTGDGLLDRQVLANDAGGGDHDGRDPRARRLHWPDRFRWPFGDGRLQRGGGSPLFRLLGFPVLRVAAHALPHGAFPFEHQQAVAHPVHEVPVVAHHQDAGVQV